MGSVGIAIAATTLSTSATRYHSILSENAGASAVGQQRLDALTHGMVARGADLQSAKREATRILDATIGRQAAVLAYDHVFALVSSLFFIGFPLVFLLRRGSEPDEVEVPVD
jgi:DHA2 family multidrug resistance protein